MIGAPVAPPLPYGDRSRPKSGGGNCCPGCAGPGWATCIGLVRALICGFARDGVSGSPRISAGEGIERNSMNRSPSNQPCRAVRPLTWLCCLIALDVPRAVSRMDCHRSRQWSDAGKDPA
jgi:hypothetical protein